MDFTGDQVNALLDLAQASLVARLLGREAPRIETGDPALLQPAGCFVSLHARETHALRGCVGRIEADHTLARVVRDTAAGALNDPRFRDDPVTLDETAGLEIEISVLSPPRAVADPLDFEPLRDGIILTVGDRSGVFLPQVARETGWGREQLLARLCTEKIGMPPTAWQLPEAKLYVFSTTILGPVPFNS